MTQQMGGSSRSILMVIYRARLQSLEDAAVSLTITLASQRRFQTAFLARWNVEGMSFDFFDDVFLLHLAFEATEGAFQ